MEIEAAYLINLPRREDRLRESHEALALGEWHRAFPYPQIFPAVDGHALPRPRTWTAGAGAFGCLLSHRRVMERIILEGINSAIVIEDDISLVADFAKKARAFIDAAPNDWDCLMLGGEHTGRAPLVSPGIRRALLCGRTHCYIVRGNFIKELYRHWMTTEGHCDHRLADLQQRYKFYTPDPFLAGQRAGTSDIMDGTTTVERFWQPVAEGLRK